MVADKSESVNSDRQPLTLGRSPNGARTGDLRSANSKFARITKESGTGLRAVVRTRHAASFDEVAPVDRVNPGGAWIQRLFFSRASCHAELSFAVRYLRCDTGVMISASHNPPQHNGFKAYWNTGGQVLPHMTHHRPYVDASPEIPSVGFDAAVSEGKIVLLTSAEPWSFRLFPCHRKTSLHCPTTAIQVPPVDQAYLDVSSLSLLVRQRNSSPLSTRRCTASVRPPSTGNCSEWVFTESAL